MTTSTSADTDATTAADVPRPQRRADVQGMRGLAVLIVVLFHANVPGFSGGFVGVDVFFVISGFVITLLLQRELEATGTIDFRRFYRRRIRRLLPASACMLLVVAAFSVFALSPLGPQGATARTGVAASLFSANLSLYLSPAGYFAPTAELNPLLHMWSLAVEEQFYLVFPAAVALLWKLFGRASSIRHRVTFALFGLSIVSFALSMWASYTPDPKFGIVEPTKLAFYGSPMRAWEFIAGAGLALLAAEVNRIPVAARRFGGLLGLVGIAWATFRLDETTPWPGLAALVPVIATVLLIIAGTNDSTSATPNETERVLSSTIMVRLGDLSYSWYLWHWPFIVLARTFDDSPALLLAAGVVSLLPAVWSYRHIEEPFRHDSGRSPIALAAACIVVPVLAFTLLQAGIDRNWGSDAVAEVAESNALHVDELRSCTRTQMADPGPLCTFGPDGNAAGRVVLIGDSTAGQFSEALVGAADEAGWQLDLVTRPGCPFAPLEITWVESANGPPQCTSFAADSIDALIADPPDLVVIGTALDRYLDEPVRWRSVGDSVVADSPEAKAEVWERVWTDMLTTLEEAGIEVRVLATNPRFDDWNLFECANHQLLRDAASCGTTADRSELLEQRSLAEDTIRGATIGLDVDVIDVFDDLCPTSVCSTNVGRTYSYRDSVHINVAQAEAFTDRFLTELIAAS